MEVSGRTAEEIGDLAAGAGIPLHELTPLRASLEEAYMSLTRDEVEYRTEHASDHLGAPEGAVR